MNTEIVLILEEFKANDVRGLILVKELGEDVRTLGVSLSPSLSFRVVEIESQDCFPKLAHYGSPQKHVNLVSLPTKERVDIWKLAEIKTACVSSALFVTC